MSWNFDADVDRKSTALVAIEEAAESYFAILGVHATQEMAEQAAKAAECAVDLLELVGTLGPWHVNLSGHANPEHAKREGWANDTVTVTVSER